MLTESERRQVLVEFNDTQTDYPRDQTIHELFEAQVLRRPNAVALSLGDERLTYGELNERANRVANYLRDIGTQRETLVGICLERSLEMIVGMLGVLKAGGAYVPIDHQYPPDRLALILEDTAAPVLLTTRAQVDRLPNFQGSLVLLDEAQSEIDGSDSNNPVVPGGALDTCYVMYTSGSTGRPKGTRILHRGVVRLVCATNYFEVDNSDVFLQFASLSFDASTFEIWAPLLNGARLEIFPAGLPSLDEIGERIRDARITTLWLTAGLFHQMVDYQLDHLAGVRQLLVGGDVVSPKHATEFLKQAQGCRLINGYGPTENTTFTCCFPMHTPADVGPSVSIGRPIANTQVYVLDQHREPVPVGVAGELYIGGDGLARDYLNDPELTSAKFVQHPFSQDADARLYRSGDLVRWHSDGTLEFLGRIDSQVKIRGFRVEPGEIEAALEQHPRVHQAVVQVTSRGGEKRLAAYYTCDPDHPLGAEALRKYLSDRLPQFMIPANWVCLDRMPLTVNGKVDRGALSSLDHSPDDQQHPYVAPRSPMESALAQIWQETLGIDRIGVHDSFFLLGGDSLQAMKISVRVQRELRESVSPVSLFRHRTIADLAEALAERSPSRQSNQIPRQTRSGPLPLSSAQQGLLFHEQYEPHSNAYNIVLGYRIEGDLDASIIEQCFQQVIDRHDILRSTFHFDRTGATQQVKASEPFHLTQVDLSEFAIGRREDKRDQYIRHASAQRFDLQHGPLIRAHLLKWSEQEHILLLAVHHIVFDGWSEGVLFRELEQLYDAIASGKRAALPELPIQYADYAAWQRESPNSPQFDADLAYWRRELAGAPPLLQLPTDRPRKDRQTFGGGTQFGKVDRRLVSQLKRISHRHGATLFMTLMAAYDILLHRFSRQLDLVVGTPFANRGHSAIEGLVGLFVNMVPLRTDLSGNPTYEQVIEQVRDITLDAYSHQQLPFDQLVHGLNVTRNPSYSRLFQVVFAYHNAATDSLKLPDMKISRLEIDAGTAKFDLTMTAVDSADGLDLWLEYNVDLFEKATARNLISSYCDVLQSIADGPGQTIESVPPRANGATMATALASVPIAVGSEHEEPSTRLEQKLAKIWERLIPIDHVNLHDNFFHIGGSSLSAMALAAEIEAEFDRKIPVAELFESNTIAAQSALIQSAAQTEHGSRLISLSRQGECCSIILLPNVMGNAITFPSLLDGMQRRRSDYSIYGIQLGYEDRKQNQTTVEQRAVECVSRILESKLPEPYHLVGYSFGGLLAYEVARQLDQIGVRVGVVGIVDGGPTDRRAASVRKTWQYCRLFVRNLPHWLLWRLTHPKEFRTDLYRVRNYFLRLRAVLQSSFETESPPVAAYIHGMQFNSKSARAMTITHIRAAKLYEPAPYGGRITLFCAKVRPLFHPLESDNGWSRVGVREIEVHNLAGDHVTIMREPVVAQVAEQLIDAIERSSGLTRDKSAETEVAAR